MDHPSLFSDSTSLTAFRSELLRKLTYMYSVDLVWLRVFATVWWAWFMTQFNLWLSYDVLRKALCSVVAPSRSGFQRKVYHCVNFHYFHPFGLSAHYSLLAFLIELRSWKVSQRMDNKTPTCMHAIKMSMHFIYEKNENKYAALVEMYM